MQELGLNEEEANFYEEKLDEGKILLFVKDLEKVGEWLQEREDARILFKFVSFKSINLLRKGDWKYMSESGLKKNKLRGKG